MVGELVMVHSMIAWWWTVGLKLISWLISRLLIDNCLISIAKRFTNHHDNMVIYHVHRFLMFVQRLAVMSFRGSISDTLLVGPILYECLIRYSSLTGNLTHHYQPSSAICNGDSITRSSPSWNFNYPSPACFFTIINQQLTMCLFTIIKSRTAVN